jgi:hypothetical protein
VKRFIERAAVNDATPWRSLLHEALHEQAEPVFTTDASNVPPASIWTGSRLWTRSFRERGLVAHDAIAIALPPGPTFAQVVAAALFENLTIVLVDPENSNAGKVPDTVRVLICDASFSANESVAHWNPAGIGGPAPFHGVLRVPRETDNGRFRIYSETGGRWLGTTDSHLLRLVEMISSEGHLTGKVCDSSYSWKDRDSLVHGLLGPLLSHAAQIVVDPQQRAKSRSTTSRGPLPVPFPHLVSL